MKKILIIGCICIASSFSNSTTAQHVNSLFSSKEPIHLRSSGSIKTIKKNTNDSTFLHGKFEYEKAPGQWVTIESDNRVRGNWRLKSCYFPPLKLKFKKADVAGTVFEGNKSLKLVLPCQLQSDMNRLIVREYLCYQFYKQITPYHFDTRLAKLNLTETSHHKPREFDLITFLVEDNSMVAKRTEGKIMELRGLSPAAFDAAQTLRNDYFQYMIGNADWSSVYQHNSNIMYAEGKYMPLPYDFDMSGFVNASYAHSSPPTLGTGDPRERVYRGFCKPKEVMEQIRNEYISAEKAIHSIIDENASYFKESDLKDMHRYIDEFYDILKDDKRFKNNIVAGCRTN